MKVSCQLCGSSDNVLLITITERPLVEIDYGIPPDKYYRQIYRCNNCGVYFNYHQLLNLTSFYQGAYNSSIDPVHSMNVRFDRIINIPFDKSDNKKRVQRVYQGLQGFASQSTCWKVLDVGSGTSVFLYELQRVANILPYCVDPDPNAVAHAKQKVEGVDATAGTLNDVAAKGPFDFISFNKVLEHVSSPINELKKAQSLLSRQGLLYVELPFGDDIARNNAYTTSAEFNVEHLTIYNQSSFKFLLNNAGFIVLDIKSMRDPSGKHTIYAFAKKNVSKDL